MAVGQKRKRSSVHFPADVKAAQPSSSNEVNAEILDYLVYNAINIAVCSSSPAARRARSVELHRHLHLVECFINIIKSNHAQLTPVTRFRLSLLQFAQLFHQATIQRTTKTSPDEQPSEWLTSLRKSNRDRAEEWWRLRRATYSQSSSQSTGEGAAEVLANKLADADEDHHSGSDSGSTDVDNEGQHPSLMDLLPLFCSLSSERAELNGSDWVTTQVWLKLAVEFMIQAFLEQHIEYGATGCSALLEAFAWGPPLDQTKPTPGSDKSKKIHDVFLLEEHNESDIATDGGSTQEEPLLSSDHFFYLRNGAINTLDPQTHTASSTAITPDALTGLYRKLLENDQDDRCLDPHPRHKFEQDLRQYLSALAKSVEVPLYRQLEEAQSGKRTRLTIDKTRLSNEETERIRLIWLRGTGVSAD